MPPQTDGDVAVVEPYYVLEEAYRMGHDRFKDTEPSGGEATHEDLSHFKQYAKWANIIAPKLRAMAGYADGGHGTYQQDRQVAAVHEGCEEDEPAEADLTRASDLHEQVVSAWDAGALDGCEDTFDPEIVQHL